MFRINLKSWMKYTLKLFQKLMREIEHELKEVEWTCSWRFNVVILNSPNIHCNSDQNLAVFLVKKISSWLYKLDENIKILV